MKRTNFYVDDERLAALKHVSMTERVSVSDLVREGTGTITCDHLDTWMLAQPPGQSLSLPVRKQIYPRCARGQRE